MVKNPVEKRKNHIIEPKNIHGLQRVGIPNVPGMMAMTKTVVVEI